MFRIGLIILASLLSIFSYAADIPAANCEIFVDRLQVARSSHSLMTIKFFIKTDSNRMDGKVDFVGVYHRRTEMRSDRGAENFDFRVDLVKKFVNSGDYFEYNAITGHDWMSAEEEVAFFAQTEKGTRYWLNQYNHPGQYFVLHSNLEYSLTRDANGNYRRDAVQVFTWDGSLAQQTSTYPDDLARKYNRIVAVNFDEGMSQNVLLFSS